MAHVTVLSADKVNYVHHTKLESGSNHLTFDLSDKEGRNATTLVIIGLPDAAQALILEALTKSNEVTNGWK